MPNDQIKLASLDGQEFFESLFETVKLVRSGKANIDDFYITAKNGAAAATEAEKKRNIALGKTNKQVLSEQQKILRSSDSLEKKEKQLIAIQKELADEYKKAGKEGERSHKEVLDDIERTNNALEQVTEQQKKFNESLDESGSTATKSSQGTGLLGGSIGKLSSIIKIAGIAAFVKMIFDLGKAAVNTAKEFKELEGRISNLTGLTGRALRRSSETALAIAQEFNKDVDEIIRTANTASSQFEGLSFEGALDNIGEQLASGQAQNEEYLDSVREYAPFFNEIGASIDDLNNVSKLSLQEGIFSDKGPDAIKEAAIRLREFTKTTEDALVTSFGKTFTREIKIKVEQGQAFEAIEEISKRFGVLSKQNQGLILADVFGGAGEDAGVEFISSLGDIEGALQKVTQETESLTQRNKVNLELTKQSNGVLNELTKNFKDVGAESETFGKVLKLGVLSVLLEFFNIAKENIAPIFSSIARSVSRFTDLFSSSSNQTERFNSVVKTTGEVFRVVIQPAIALNELIAEFIDYLIDAYEANGLFTDAVHFTGDAFGFLVKVVEFSINTLTGFIRLLKQPINVLNAFKQGVETTFQSVADVFSNFKNDIANIGIVEAIKNAFFGIKEAGANIGKNFSDAFSENLDLRTGVQKEIDYLKSRKSELESQINKVFGNVDGLTIGVNTDVSKVKDLENELKAVNTQLDIIDLKKQIEIETDPFALNILKTQLDELQGIAKSTNTIINKPKNPNKPVSDLESTKKEQEKLLKAEEALLKKLDKLQRERLAKEVQNEQDTLIKIAKTRELAIKQYEAELQEANTEIARLLAEGQIDQEQAATLKAQFKLETEFRISSVKVTTNQAAIAEGLKRVEQEIKEIDPPKVLINADGELQLDAFDNAQQKLVDDIELVKSQLALSDEELAGLNISRTAYENVLADLLALQKQLDSEEASTNKELIEGRLAAIQANSDSLTLITKANGDFYDDLGKLTKEGEAKIAKIQREGLLKRRALFEQLQQLLKDGLITSDELGIDGQAIADELNKIDEALLGIDFTEVNKDFEEFGEKIDAVKEAGGEIVNILNSSFGGIKFDSLENAFSKVLDAMAADADKKGAAIGNAVAASVSAVADIAGQFVGEALERNQEVQNSLDEQLSDNADRLAEHQELRAQGLANNVDALLAKEGELKAKQAQAAKERQKLLRIQLAADTAQQISGIATAAVNIIANESLKGGIAGALIGATFAAGLIAIIANIRSAAKAGLQTEGLFKGGYTGDGSPTDESGHFTHKQEYVIPHKPTQKYRKNLLEGIHHGERSKVAEGAKVLAENFGLNVEDIFGAAPPPPPKININYAKLNSDMATANEVTLKREIELKAQADAKIQKQMLDKLGAIEKYNKATAGNTGVQVYEVNGKVIKETTNGNSITKKVLGKTTTKKTHK